MTPHRKLFVFGIALALAGVLVAGFAVFVGNFSARGYVADKFTRSTSDDIGNDAIAYTSSKAPTQVAAQIRNVWEPADEVVDASGVYLRYSDDAIVILPAAIGSLILVEKVSTAYARHHSHVSGYWGWAAAPACAAADPAQVSDDRYERKALRPMELLTDLLVTLTYGVIGVA